MSTVEQPDQHSALVASKTRCTLLNEHAAYIKQYADMLDQYERLELEREEVAELDPEDPSLEELSQEFDEYEWSIDEFRLDAERKMGNALATKIAAMLFIEQVASDSSAHCMHPSTGSFFLFNGRRYDCWANLDSNRIRWSIKGGPGEFGLIQNDQEKLTRMIVHLSASQTAQD